MNENEDLELRPIRRALISVSDKTGIVDFARELKSFNVKIISTGGTAIALRDAGIEVNDVSEITRFPEIMDGRVKTLHPQIHGALLAVRDNLEHQKAMHEHGIEPIDMVVINLYPFEQTISGVGVTVEEAIEQIDIGGPAMIRSAAKNSKDVVVINSTEDYPAVAEELRRNDGAVCGATRRRLAQRAFMRTATYDLTIAGYLASQENAGGIGALAGSGPIPPSETKALIDDRDSSIETFRGSLPDRAAWTISKTANLRYGENPHQAAALYKTASRHGIANAELLSGKEMSFNNYVDADAAWRLVCDFNELVCAIIKHTNPAGVGAGDNAEEAYRKALATDPLSAFGGIVAFNRAVDGQAARAVTEIFTEVVVAPDYDAEALKFLRDKKNLRVLRMGSTNNDGGLEYKQISGGLLLQTRDDHQVKRDNLKVVSKRQPTKDEIRALMFAWTVCKHTKSNAIVYARYGQTVGVGAGQMSRVDSVKIGAMRAQLSVKDSVLASDAFFPFRDGVDVAAQYGITAVIQPGGSVRDAEVIAAADEHELAMIFTGIRHFKH